MPRFLARFGACIGTNRLKVMEQKPVVHLHPSRQQLIDAVGHFGRASLGKGDAQQIFRLDVIFQQKPNDARREHLRFTRPCRRAEPDIVARHNGAALGSN